VFHLEYYSPKRQLKHDLTWLHLAHHSATAIRLLQIKWVSPPSDPCPDWHNAFVHTPKFIRSTRLYAKQQESWFTTQSVQHAFLGMNFWVGCVRMFSSQCNQVQQSTPSSFSAGSTEWFRHQAGALALSLELASRPHHQTFTLVLQSLVSEACWRLSPSQILSDYFLFSHVQAFLPRPKTDCTKQE